MKILLTGATGNVGGHVLPLLLERGHDVRCLVFDSKNERKIVNGWKRKPEVVWGDIQDERAVESAVAGVEAVIHLAQLTALESTGEYDWYEEGAATMRSRLDYVKERLRLLYVGITRAKRDLIVTWNTGRQGDATPSLALSELMGWWEV